MTRGAVAAAHYQNEDLARYNSNLAYALGLRFERTGCQEDLDEAVAAGRRSVSLISGNHPERARFLANLGSVLQARYEYAGCRGRPECCHGCAHRGVGRGRGTGPATPGRGQVGRRRPGCIC